MIEPKIRFKRDDGSSYTPMINAKLGNLTFPVSEKNGKRNYPVYSVNNQRGFIPQSDQFEEKEVAS